MSDNGRSPKTWAEFWWDSNSCYGEVSDRRSWLAMVERFRADSAVSLLDAARDMITRGRRCDSALYKRPDFGLRAEHQGVTLAEWALSVGIDLLDELKHEDADTSVHVEPAPNPTTSILGADIVAFAKAWPPGANWSYEPAGGVDYLDDCSPSRIYSADELGLICWAGRGVPQGGPPELQYDDAYNLADWLAVWLRGQTTTRLVIEVPTERLNALRTFLAGIGGSTLADHGSASASQPT